MSVEHMAMVFAAEGLNGADKLLLLALTNYTDAHGYCWPGQERLAADTGTSVSTVKRARKSLMDQNLIKSVRRTDRTGQPITNLTRVNLPLLASLARPNRAFDDNAVEQITFATDTTGQPKTASDLLRAQSGPYYGADRSGVGLNLVPTPDQIEPQSLIDPPEEPSSPQPPAGSNTDAVAEQQGGGGEDAPQEDVLRAETFVDGLPYCGRIPGPKARAHLVARVGQALAGGWAESDLRRQLTADTSNAKSMSAVYRYRLEPENLPDAPAPVPAQRTVLPLRPSCPGCERPLANGSNAVLCRDCREAG